jgi:hypothetical protein
MAAMTEAFERELARSLERLRESIGPYTRFVRAERQKLVQIEEEMDAIGASLGQIRGRIEEL